MSRRAIIRNAIVTILAVLVSFLAGWQLRGFLQLGEQAMGEFMTAYSALAYLDKGDIDSAKLILRYSAERSLLTADAIGTPKLDWDSPGVRYKWFARYSELRSKLPSKPPTVADELNPRFDEEVQEVLNRAKQHTERKKWTEELKNKQ